MYKNLGNKRVKNIIAKVKTYKRSTAHLIKILMFNIWFEA